MCTCGDEVIKIESKRSRVLKAYDIFKHIHILKPDIFERE